MLMLKICHACDSILGELESDGLTNDYSDSIMDVVGNVAYTLCPACYRQIKGEPRRVYH